MTTKILIENGGEFHIPHEKVAELINWLNHAQAIRTTPKTEQVKEIINNQFTGKELING
jgi:hypothetical protein